MMMATGEVGRRELAVPGGVLANLLLGLLIVASPTSAQNPANLQSLPYDTTYAQEPGRFALVIGNPDYRELPPLGSARRDAVETERQLRELGFTVVREDSLPNRRDFEDRILPNFRRRIQRGDVVIFYYSGHGFSFGGANYLAPADLTLDISDVGKVDRLAVAVDGIESALARVEPAVLLMLVDACRSIPGFRIRDPTTPTPNLVGKGVAAPEPFPGLNVLVGYATRPGMQSLGYTADDQLSPYTEGLLRYIDIPDQEFGSIYRDVTLHVRRVTQGRQDPGLAAYSASDLYLNPTDATRRKIREVLEVALSSEDPENVRYFTERYATSRYAPIARRWLEENPPGRARKYTHLSPVAVERFWRNAGANIVRSASTLAYARSVESAETEAQRLSDWELGIANDSTTVSNIEGVVADQRRLVAIAAHEVAIATVTVAAYSGPSTDLQTTSLPPGTVLKVDAISGAAANWIRASVAGDDRPLYVQVASRPDQLELVNIGRPLRESHIPRVRSGTEELVDSAAVDRALRKAQEAGSVLWVSLATAATDDGRETAYRRMRRAHVELLLKRHGIDGRRITSVGAAPQMYGPAVRIRFFGY